jgi:anti-sigma regulatory factor (Ser/Thr protein kinase)
MTGETMVDMRTDQRPSVSLVVPCRPEYVALCRLVVGALGVREALDEETIGDLKVVVTEVFTCFLTADDHASSASQEAVSCAVSEDASSLRLDVFAGSDVWTILVSNPDRRRRISLSSPWDAMNEGGLGLTIIEALVDSVELTDSEDEGSVFRLAKRIMGTDESEEEAHKG